VLQNISRSRDARGYVRALDAAVGWDETARATDFLRHAETAVTCAQIVVERVRFVVAVVGGEERAELAQLTAAAAAMTTGRVKRILNEALLVLSA
jgi:O-succinylbenzoate synthase